VHYFLYATVDNSIYRRISYFIINLVTKAEAAAFLCLEQVEVGIISLTDVKTQNYDKFPFFFHLLQEPKIRTLFQPVKLDMSWYLSARLLDTLCRFGVDH